MLSNHIRCSIIQRTAIYTYLVDVLKRHWLNYCQPSVRDPTLCRCLAVSYMRSHLFHNAMFNCSSAAIKLVGSGRKTQGCQQWWMIWHKFWIQPSLRPITANTSPPLFESWKSPCSTHAGHIGTDRSLLTWHLWRALSHRHDNTWTAFGEPVVGTSGVKFITFCQNSTFLKQPDCTGFKH